MADIAIFYVSGAVVVGGLVACLEEHSVRCKGRQLRCSQLICSAIAGIVWPWTVMQMLSL